MGNFHKIWDNNTHLVFSTYPVCKQTGKQMMVKKLSLPPVTQVGGKTKNKLCGDLCIECVHMTS